MSELFVSRPLSSEKVGVTAAPSISTPLTSSEVVRFISNRNVHVRVASGSASAAVTDMLVYAYHAVFLAVAAGESVHMVRATGEVDGDAWVTVLKRA